ncbi:MAG: methyltransferase domain-containing protein [Thermoguttaceae bacterium]|jgi:phospholipid N-methyltransferase
MAAHLSDCGVFLREFVRNFHTTGALLPSGRFLARALARFVAEPASRARRILEVGPGTGAVTRRIVAALGAEDRLDLVELNDAFVQCLQERFQREPAFQAVAGRSRVHHCALQDLPADGTYDLVISGLPLNNFAVGDVEQILGVLAGLLEPGGTLSFFQYIAVRRLKAVFSGSAERERLRGIGVVLERLLSSYEVRRDWVWPNIPPAWVHHVRFAPAN